MQRKLAVLVAGVLLLSSTAAFASRDAADMDDPKAAGEVYVQTTDQLIVAPADIEQDVAQDSPRHRDLDLDF